MFRTSIAVTLLAIFVCSNAHGQTTAKKPSALANWWRGQTSQYTQRNRNVLRRTPSTRQRQPVRRVSAQQQMPQWQPTPTPPPAPPALLAGATPATNKTRVVHVPGRGAVRVAEQPVRSRTRSASPALTAKPQRVPQPRRVASSNVPVQRAAAPLRPVPAQPVSMQSSGSVYHGGSAVPSGAMSFGTYPNTGASLYPSPQPNVPYQVGGTAITNQAFYPHEMLYAHKYKSLYGPYYYRVKGGWAATPFGMWSHEDWKVEGTEVEVEYRSHISPFAGFKPPFYR